MSLGKAFSAGLLAYGAGLREEGKAKINKDWELYKLDRTEEIATGVAKHQRYQKATEFTITSLESRYKSINNRLKGEFGAIQVTNPAERLALEQERDRIRANMQQLSASYLQYAGYPTSAIEQLWPNMFNTDEDGEITGLNEKGKNIALAAESMATEEEDVGEKETMGTGAAEKALKSVGVEEGEHPDWGKHGYKFPGKKEKSRITAKKFNEQLQAIVTETDWAAAIEALKAGLIGSYDAITKGTGQAAEKVFGDKAPDKVIAETILESKDDLVGKDGTVAELREKIENDDGVRSVIVEKAIEKISPSQFDDTMDESAAGEESGLIKQAELIPGGGGEGGEWYWDGSEWKQAGFATDVDSGVDRSFLQGAKGAWKEVEPSGDLGTRERPVGAWREVEPSGIIGTRERPVGAWKDLSDEEQPYKDYAPTVPAYDAGSLTEATTELGQSYAPAPGTVDVPDANQAATKEILGSVERRAPIPKTTSDDIRKYVAKVKGYADKGDHQSIVDLVTDDLPRMYLKVEDNVSKDAFLSNVSNELFKEGLSDYIPKGWTFKLNTAIAGLIIGGEAWFNKFVLSD